VDLRLSNKRVLIAGASRGIGLSIAEGFLSEGARVALLARTPAPLMDVAARLRAAHGEDRVSAFPCDCSEPTGWADITDRIVSAWGGLDVVVANAGDGRSVADPLPDADHFASTWRENFATAETTARATIPLLQIGGGCLLFISSIGGLEAIGAPTDYSVAKSALTSLAKLLSHKLAPGVRVNCVAPGNIHFPGGVWDAKVAANPNGIAAMIDDVVPLRRFGTVDEVADAALFLCSDRARFITGVCLVVDGGQTLRLL
jgi:3-oxoacyl-[acyl-carrier protein] reductase